MEIEKLYKAHRAYELGNPIMSDAEYDARFNLLTRPNQDKLLNQINAFSPHAQKPKTLGSTRNLNDFLNKYDDKAMFDISQKLDGCCLIITYKNGRLIGGKSKSGKLSLPLNKLKAIKGIPNHLAQKQDKEIHGELCLTESELKEVNKWKLDRDDRYAGMGSGKGFAKAQTAIARCLAWEAPLHIFKRMTFHPHNVFPRQETFTDDITSLVGEFDYVNTNPIMSKQFVMAEVEGMLEAVITKQVDYECDGVVVRQINHEANHEDAVKTFYSGAIAIKKFSQLS